MVVALRKRQVECCEKLASDLAAAKKRFTKTNHSHDEASYEKLLISTTITLERKKALLLKELRSLFIAAFALDQEAIKGKKARVIQNLKANVAILRRIANRLADEIYYMQHTLMEEFGIRKATSWGELSDREIAKHILEQEQSLRGESMQALQKLASHAHAIIAKETRKITFIIKAGAGRVQLKDLPSILHREAELLAHIEAKLPPPRAISPSLLGRKAFHAWTASLIALIGSLEAEQQEEAAALQLLKRKAQAKVKLTSRISRLVRQHWQDLAQHEKRMLTCMEAEILPEHHKASHHYAAASRL